RTGTRAMAMGCLPWTASVTGYAEQAHLTRETVRLAGLTRAALAVHRRPALSAQGGHPEVRVGVHLRGAELVGQPPLLAEQPGLVGVVRGRRVGGLGVGEDGRAERAGPAVL